MARPWLRSRGLLGPAESSFGSPRGPHAPRSSPVRFIPGAADRKRDPLTGSFLHVPAARFEPSFLTERPGPRRRYGVRHRVGPGGGRRPTSRGAVLAPPGGRPPRGRAYWRRAARRVTRRRRLHRP